MNCYGYIDIGEERVVLFVPKMEEVNKIWMTVKSLEDFSAKYELEVRNVSDLKKFMASECPIDSTTVYINGGKGQSGGENLVPE